MPVIPGNVTCNSVESGGVKIDRLGCVTTQGKTGERTGFPGAELIIGPLAELADAMDSKSLARKGVSVRLR